MGNHNILDREGIDITNEDNWYALHTTELPDGIAVATVELSELLNRNERLDVVLPLNEVLTAAGVLQETLAIIAQHSSRIGLWTDTTTTTEQLDTLLKLQQQATAASEDNELANKTLVRALDLIVIYTPLFTDGRGFSLARHLRLEGYTGEIRMAGAFGRDQIPYLMRSGVDTFAIAHENMVDDIQTAFYALPTAYSGDDASRLPMFRTAQAEIQVDEPPVAHA
jgi:uncharacterized protein (DUF934 family)